MACGAARRERGGSRYGDLSDRGATPRGFLNAGTLSARAGKWLPQAVRKQPFRTYSRTALVVREPSRGDFPTFGERRQSARRVDIDAYGKTLLIKRVIYGLRGVLRDDRAAALDRSQAGQRRTISQAAVSAASMRRHPPSISLRSPSGSSSCTTTATASFP